ncbi:MAG: hypothetical protein A4E53_01047 [Pelotomaculum sp. PtaB.Bin104]|nr:MAG: hypothetical protein A4E53_01047 [Pelotomaculum sp. PtaB.Bin104]
MQLDGNEPTTSHPTLVEKNGKKYVYIGTYSQYMDIVDITDFNNVNQGSLISKQSPQSSDITSAPLVLNWRGHEIMVSTTGNTGKVYILADALDQNKVNGFHINVGSGRTSSSPAPVAGGTAFAVGLDCGFQTHGELRLYYLDDILSEDSSGKIVKKSDNARVAESLPSGLVASFAVDGNMLYFGDSNSNVYVYNVTTGNMAKNTDNAGTFSNRSPALTASRVYFPVTNYGSADAQGKLLVIERSDGSTAYALPMEYKGENLGRAMTAPVVLRGPDNSACVLIGTGLGDVNIINPFTGGTHTAFKVADITGDPGYASGVSGEISAWENICVTTSEQGMIIWQLKPEVNLLVTDITLDPSLGNIGQPTNGNITVKNESKKSFTGTSTLWRVRHPDGSVLAENTIVTDLAAGEQKTLPFSFTPDIAGEYSVAAMINPDHSNPPDEVNFLNGDWPGDNRMEVPYIVKGKDYDIKVEITPGMNPWETIDNPAYMWANIVVSRKDELPETLPVRLTINGAGGTVVKTFDFPQGGSPYEYQYYITASESGYYNAEAQAWPYDDSWVDIYPPDNVDSTSIQYIYNPPPTIDPLDNQIHGEIIDSELN